MASDREHAHRLLDQLPPDQLAALVRLLETIVSADEEEGLSATDRQAIGEADQWLEQNRPIPNEDVLADFGLTTEDWEKMGREEAPRGNG